MFDLQAYLHEKIPISAAMQVRVAEVSCHSIVLAAPLGPNINHQQTLFGGSAAAVAILAAWSLLHVRLRAEGIACDLVIQSNSIDYDLPVTADFTARSMLADPTGWERFLKTLARHGRARIEVGSVLEFGGSVAARSNGRFVALMTGHTNRSAT